MRALRYSSYYSLLLNDLEVSKEERECVVLSLSCSDDAHNSSDNAANPTDEGNALHDGDDDSVINVTSYER